MGKRLKVPVFHLEAGNRSFDPNVPVLVTMRTAAGVPSLLQPDFSAVVVEELARASERRFRILHSSVQDAVVLLVIEARDAVSFARGMQAIASRIARRVNSLVGRSGRFWHERYARRDLTTARERRKAIALVRGK